MVDADKLLESLTDEEIIEILEELGCEKYKEYKGYITFSTSVCHDGLHLNLIYFRDSKHFRCFSGCKENYNIYTLIQKNKNCSFLEALNYISNFVNRQYIKEKIDNKDLIDDWKWIKKLKKKNREYNTNKILKPELLNQYILLPHIKWVNDGILPSTQIKWGVMYDLKTDRICYGIYTEDNQLISVKGRSVSDDIEPKYLYLYPCIKSNILVGLNKNLSNILENKKCIVFESFKSVIIADQWNYSFGVSIEGNSISDWQLKKLLQLESEIILAFDKNVDKENKEFYKNIINKIKNYSKLSIIYDKDNLLIDKASPVDMGEDIFKILYNKRYKIN